MTDVNLLFATIVGLVTPLILGIAKSGDTKLAALLGKLGNVTPVLVLALNFALPKLWALGHLAGAVPDATILLNTPVSTAISIVAREITVWVQGHFTTPPAVA